MIKERTEVVLFRVNKKTEQTMYLKTLVDNNKLDSLRPTWTKYLKDADIFPSKELLQIITKDLNVYDFDDYEYGYWTTIVEEVR